MFSKFSIGVSISGTHACIVCLEKIFSDIQVKASARVDFNKSDTLSHHLENLETYFLNFIESNNVGNPEVYLGFPRNFSIVRQLEFPLAVKDDLFSTVQYSLEKYIPLKSEDLYFDCAVISENKTRETVSIILGAAKKKDVKPFVDLAASLETGVSGIDIDSSGIINYYSHNTSVFDKKDRKNDHLFLCYIDDDCLDISFFNKGEFVYSKYLKRDETSDIFQTVNTQIQTTAELQNSLIPEISLSFCGSGVDQELIQRFDQTPRIRIIRHDYSRYGLSSENFIPAFGLALKGFIKKPTFNLNLLPESKRKKESKAAIYGMYFLVCFALFLSIVWGGSYFFNQKMVQKEIDSELKKLESQVMAINEKKEEIRDLEEKVKTINQLRNEQVLISHILNELSNTIPSGSWIQSFSFNMEKGGRISGYSDAASDLITLLEASAFFRNAVFVSAITKSPEGKERFSIGFELEKEE